MPVFDKRLLHTPTLALTPMLLGHGLRVNTTDHSWQTFRIVEVEAYTGDDPACHAYQADPTKPPTPRAANLYQRPGLAYVYLIYGMYHCLNIVTEAEGTPGAILFRGLVAADDNSPFAQQNLIGPGRLCRQLGITKAEHNGVDMLADDSPLQLVPLAAPTPPECIKATPRIGITKAVDYPWRFIDTRYVTK